MVIQNYDPLWMADMAAIARRAYVPRSGKEPGTIVLTRGDDVVLVERQMVRTVRGQIAAIVVSCKGTKTLWQWLSNLRVWMRPVKYGGARIHPGFWETAESLAGAVADAIKTLGPNLPVYQTGHSRGGSVMKCMAFLLNKAVGVSGVATFGCPRVGDSQWCAMYNVGLLQRTWCSINHNDVFTRVPFTRWGYRHCGRPVYIDRKQIVHPDANMGRVWWDRLVGRVQSWLRLRAGDGARDHMNWQYSGIHSSKATDFEEQATQPERTLT